MRQIENCQALRAEYGLVPKTTVRLESLKEIGGCSEQEGSLLAGMGMASPVLGVEFYL